MNFQEMYLFIFGFVILKLQITVSDPQFPPHTDLQNVGEAIINNEKFKILKPTAHLVTDHFKDFILKQESVHPGDRVFIDKNGFRHAWSGFGDKSKSLRKTHLKSNLKHVSGNFEDDSEKTLASSIISTDTELPDSKETATTINVPFGAHEINSTENTREQRTSDKNKTDGKVAGTQDNTKDKSATTAKDKTTIGRERPVATTTFYCPFFGVIKTSAFIN